MKDKNKNNKYYYKYFKMFFLQKCKCDRFKLQPIII